MYIIVVGGGRLGYYLLKALLNEGHEVLLMEKDARICKTITDEMGSVCYRGDGCEAATLAEVGTGRLHALYFDAFLDRLTGIESDSLSAGPARRLAWGELGDLVPVEVTAPDPLSETDEERLRRALSSLLEKEVRLESRVDPSLIGGALVRFGDHLIDGSLRGQLALLRERLVEELAET